MQRILLIGFRGAGKTTLGKALAEALNLAFIDADEEIEKREGRTIKEMVEKEGWSYFRHLEKVFLKELQEKKNIVCALGGGAVLHEEEMRALKQDSLIIWVFAELDEIKERLSRDFKTLSQRPALTELTWDEELELLYKEREPLYQKWAHLKVDTQRNDQSQLLSQIKTYFNKEEAYG
jgi:shikimate kinase